MRVSQWFLRHLAMPRDIFHCHNWGWGARHWHLVTRSQDTAEYPTVQQTAPYNKELFGPIANNSEVKKCGREENSSRRASQRGKCQPGFS